MSLQKDSCERCWLPPTPGETLCRKCRGAPPHELSRWIRYHITSSDPDGCPRYRKIIGEDIYYGSVIPQDCLHCCAFLLQLGQPSWTAALKQHIIQISHHDLATLFRGSLEHRKDAVLDYVDGLLDFHQADTLTTKKIVNALISASNNRASWVLEELILRPTNLRTLLFAPIQIPSHIPEDLYGHFAEIEGWWTFWEKMPAAAQRRVKFRCLKIKEELLEKTWAPERVLEWCMDLDSVENVRGMRLP